MKTNKVKGDTSPLPQNAACLKRHVSSGLFSLLAFCGSRLQEKTLKIKKILFVNNAICCASWPLDAHNVAYFKAIVLGHGIIKS